MNAWLNWNGKEVIPVGFLTIYVVAIVILGAIIIAINIRLIRREKNENADGSATPSSAGDGQRDATVSALRQKTEPEPFEPRAVSNAHPHQGVPGAMHDGALAPAKMTAAAHAQAASTPIFRQRPQPVPPQPTDAAEKIRPAEALDEAMQEKRDPFEMTDADYRDALRQLSGLVTPDKTPASDDESMVNSDDAYRAALRSMMNKKQDSR